MNLYFLVEGRRTEKKVYPQWLAVLAPQLIQIKNARDVDSNNFFLFSGEGYPSILNHLRNAVTDVNAIGKYDFLVVCLDAEETSIKERKECINLYLSENHINLKKAQLIIIVQNPCFETWFLGNRKIFKRHPESNLLKEYIDFYNIQTEDPELMPSKEDFTTKAQFHHDYLQEIFQERGITYSK